MTQKRPSPLSALPSVDRLLKTADVAHLIAEYGRISVIHAIRIALAKARTEGTAGKPIPDTKVILSTVTEHLTQLALPSLRPVHNLTGTVLHTNLGRAGPGGL